MKRIKLTQGKYALVDDADYVFLNQYRWHASKERHRYYAVRGMPRSNPKRRVIRMHRVILGVPKDVEVDHINGNGLDNRRENLRSCTSGQNSMHQRIHFDNTIGFKGVHLMGRHRRKPYRVRIQANRRRVHIGCYETAREVAYAYDLAAIKYHREFALTNEMLGLL